jgi:hypothetical protein
VCVCVCACVVYVRTLGSEVFVVVVHMRLQKGVHGH